MSVEDMISMLLAWCKDNGIWIDTRLSVVGDSENGGLRVCNNSGSRIDESVTRKHCPVLYISSVY